MYLIWTVQEVKIQVPKNVGKSRNTYLHDDQEQHE